MAAHPLNLDLYEQEWNRLMDACSIARCEPRQRAFRELVAAYSEPTRHYHNLGHIGYLLNELHSLRVILNEPAQVELAIWYHDVVYDSSSTENEVRSADFAAKALTELGFTAEWIERVCQLILFTRTHQAPAMDADALLFLDLDLSILAASWRRYSEYAQAIRREYQQFSDRDYCLGRKRVLEGFSRRARIFQSEVYHQWHDRQVRANIAAEIAQIDDTLRTLSP